MQLDLSSEDEDVEQFIIDADLDVQPKARALRYDLCIVYVICSFRIGFGRSTLSL